MQDCEQVSDWATITATDGEDDGSVKLRLTFKEGINRMGHVAKVAQAFYAKLAGGQIDERLSGYDTGLEGLAMIVLELTVNGDVDISVSCDPPISVARGEISAAQALVMTALAEIQDELQTGPVRFTHRN